MSRAKTVKKSFRFKVRSETAWGINRDSIVDHRFVHLVGIAAHTLQVSPGGLWVMGSFAASPPVLFHYADSRRQSVPLNLLDENVGAIMVDGYEGYEKACQQC